MTAITNLETGQVNVHLTLFSAYHPLEEYLRIMEQTGAILPPPRVLLRPLDVYLIRLLTQFYPRGVTLIDLAAEATGGATTVLGLTDPHIRTTIVPQLNEYVTGEDWRAQFQIAVTEMGLDLSRLSTDVELNTPDGLETLRTRIPPLSNPMFLLAVTEDTRLKLPTQLDTIFALHPNSLVLVLPVGRIGEDQLLMAILTYANKTNKQLTALRELSSFLSSSLLALISQPDDPQLKAVLARVQQQFDGNFQFLPLVREVTQAAIRVNQYKEERNVVQRERDELEERLRKLYNQSLADEGAHLIKRLVPVSVKNTLKKLLGRPTWK